MYYVGVMIFFFVLLNVCCNILYFSSYCAGGLVFTSFVAYNYFSVFLFNVLLVIIDVVLVVIKGNFKLLFFL